jgi:hypothetical protein
MENVSLHGWKTRRLPAPSKMDGNPPGKDQHSHRGQRLRAEEPTHAVSGSSDRMMQEISDRLYPKTKEERFAGHLTGESGDVVTMVRWNLEDGARVLRMLGFSSTVLPARCISSPSSASTTG